MSSIDLDSCCPVFMEGNYLTNAKDRWRLGSNVDEVIFPVNVTFVGKASKASNITSDSAQSRTVKRKLLIPL